MYYTYAYLRKEDRTPYYIGKGQKRRMYAAHWRGKTNFTPKDKDRIIVLKYFEDEESAYLHERYIITILGRKDLGTGILINITDGGIGGKSNLSEETRKKLREFNQGKIITQETRQKISDANRGKKCPEHLKEHFSKLFTGKGNPHYGKKHSPETLKKISDATKNKNLKVRWYLTPEKEILKVENLIEFCKENNFHYGSLVAVYNGKKSYYKGYTRYNHEPIQKNNRTLTNIKHTEETKLKIKEKNTKYIYTLISPSGQKYVKKFVVDFCNKIGLPHKGVTNAARNGPKKYRGWTCSRVPYVRETSPTSP